MTEEPVYVARNLSFPPDTHTYIHIYIRTYAHVAGSAREHGQPAHARGCGGEERRARRDAARGGPQLKSLSR